MPQALEEQVYMHPNSAMAKAAPDLVVYMQIVRTEKRPYMTGAVLLFWQRNHPCCAHQILR